MIQFLFRFGRPHTYFRVSSTRTAASVPDEVARLPEYIQREKMISALRRGSLDYYPSADMTTNYASSFITPEKTSLLLDATLSTFFLHVQARIASSQGKGFYTIGPCGEEALAAVGLCLQKTDASALHYRHVAVGIFFFLYLHFYHC